MRYTTWIRNLEREKKTEREEKREITSITIKLTKIKVDVAKKYVYFFVEKNSEKYVLIEYKEKESQQKATLIVVVFVVVVGFLFVFHLYLLPILYFNLFSLYIYIFNVVDERFFFENLDDLHDIMQYFWAKKNKLMIFNSDDTIIGSI